MQKFQLQELQSKLKDLSPKSITIFLGAILLFISLIAYGFTQSRSTNSTPTQENNTITPTITAPHTIVYGAWKNDESKIYAYDLSSHTEYLLAALPLNVKKVSILSPTQLLYIAQTDIRDHGQEIALYDMKTNTSQTLFTSTETYGIDDYVLSPNKEYIALWEVQMNPDSSILAGGKSRIYTGRISQPNQKNIIYEENATFNTPIRYPRAILNDGTLFTDKFIPNSGSGQWAYGMSSSNFTGTQKEDIEAMQNGTYATQPILSPDGNSMLFAGYDGSKGAGTSERNNFRLAILEPNTIELLDVHSKTRSELPNLPNTNTYLYPSWDTVTDNISYTILSANINEIGTYLYTISSGSVQKINSQDNELLVSTLTENLQLTGEILRNSNLATSNLGELLYSAPYTKLFITDTSGKRLETLQLSTNLIQFMGIFPGNMFANSGEIIAIDGKTQNKDTLQLITLEMPKPELIEKREEHQTQPLPEYNAPIKQPEVTGSPETVDNPEYVKPPPTSTPVPHNLPPIRVCDDIGREQCTAQLGDPSTFTEKKQRTEFNHCVSQVAYREDILGNCRMTPLYLYGTEGLEVTATVHTPIFNTNVPHVNNSFTVKLGKNGQMHIGNSVISGIEYDYIPALRTLKPPTKGKVVSKSEIEPTIRYYAKNLRLNTQETNDLIAYSKQVLTKPYAFISFYDHQTSHAILPLTFEPQPDVYRNIVFYFKNLPIHPSFSPELPYFDPIIRNGFTAVEISVIADN